MTNPTPLYAIDVHNDDGDCYDLCIFKDGRPIATVTTSDCEIVPLVRAGNLMPGMLNALLDIKRLAGKSGDDESDPFTLLDLISNQVQSILAKVSL